MTRAELESRRIEAIPDLDADISPSELARKYGVSRTTIYRWYDARQLGVSRLADGKLVNVPRTLERRKAPGRPPKWNEGQMKWAKWVFDDGPRKILGINSDKWTQERFRKALRLKLQLELSPDHVGRLMHQWGLR